MTYPNHTRLDCTCNTVSPHNIFGEHSRSWTKLSIVRLLDRFVFCLEALDDHKWTEDLFSYNPHVIATISEDGRLNKVSLLWDAVLLAAMDELCPIRSRCIDVG